PNAGKSPLFNALAASRAALVSDMAGTTRDYLTAEVTLDGVALSLVDTAGHEARTDGISQEAQHLRQEQIDRADLIVWCQPADEPPEPAPFESLPDLRERVLPVVTKCDLDVVAGASLTLAVSARCGTGLRELIAAIAARLSSPARGERQLLGTTAARGHDSLLKAQATLDRALAIARREADQ